MPQIKETPSQFNVAISRNLIEVFFICLLISLTMEKEEEHVCEAMQSSSPDSFSNELPYRLQSVTDDEESDNTCSPAECSLSPNGPERSDQTLNTSVLVQWVKEHLSDPCPTKREKKKLAVISGMTLRQVNNWFAGEFWIRFHGLQLELITM